MMRRGLSGAAVLLLLCGCVSFEYDGKSGGAPTENVRVYSDAAKLPRAYEVLGTATVSADYTDVSRDRMLAKLVSEAADRGADAVLLTDQQVVPYSQRNASPKFNTMYDLDNESSSWAQIYKDVDLTYGNAAGTPGDNATVTSYNRVIKAEFLKFTGEARPAAEAEELPAGE